jgi:hypothetical protein
MGKITTFEAAKAVIRRNSEDAGHAPPPKPIRGYFADSWVEPIFLGSLWVLNALGALLSPLPLVKWNCRVVGVALFCWSGGDLLLVFFSAMNYFAHIGLLINTSDSF